MFSALSGLAASALKRSPIHASQSQFTAVRKPAGHGGLAANVVSGAGALNAPVLKPTAA